MASTHYVRTIYEGNIAETDRRIIVAKSYAEAAGFIVAHKAGTCFYLVTVSMHHYKYARTFVPVSISSAHVFLWLCEYLSVYA